MPSSDRRRHSTQSMGSKSLLPRSSHRDRANGRLTIRGYWSKRGSRLLNKFATRENERDRERERKGGRLGILLVPTIAAGWTGRRKWLASPARCRIDPGGERRGRGEGNLRIDVNQAMFIFVRTIFAGAVIWRESRNRRHLEVGI